MYSCLENIASCEVIGCKSDPLEIRDFLVPIDQVFVEHVEGVDRLVLSSTLVLIFGIVQSPVDRDIGEGHLACPKRQVA